jgi:Ca-activated chloride channel family protein
MKRRDVSVVTAGRVFVALGIGLIGAAAALAWTGGGPYEPSANAPRLPGTSARPAEPARARPALPAPGAAANSDLSIAVSFDHSLVAPEAREATAMVEVAVPENDALERRPVAIAIVLDRSGSMKGNKIANATRAAHGLIDKLTDGDAVIVVSFAADAEVHFASTSLGADREAAHDAVDAIRVSGNTCVSCGLDEAYELLARAPRGHARRAVVLSDGEANRGSRLPTELGALAGWGRTDRAIATATIGIGQGYDTDVMRTIAEGGAGGYYFVHNSNEIADVLTREADSLARVAVDDVAVRVIAVAPAVAIDGGEHRTVIGQLAPGDRRRVVVPVRLSQGELGDAIEVETSYVDADGARRTLVARAALARNGDAKQREASADPNVIAEAARQETPAVVTAALAGYDKGEVEKAARQIEAQAARLEVTAGATGMAAPAREAVELRTLAERVRKHKPASKAAVITQRLNDARNLEVKKGVPADDMYYDGDRANAAPRAADELE